MNEMPPADASSSAIIASDAEFFSKTGPIPSSWDDGRRFPRFYYRGRIQATIYPLPNSQEQEPVECYLLTRDVSRGGMNLLHTEQLFPQQRMDVVLKEAVRSVEIVWCRRIAHRCYSLGCRFVKTDVECSEVAVAESAPVDPIARMSS